MMKIGSDILKGIVLLSEPKRMNILLSLAVERTVL
jgi:hypothetical protein